MKKWFKISLIAGSIAAVFSACKKDETRSVVTPADSTTLTATATEVVLTEENAEQVATVFNWATADFGIKDQAVTYTLQFDLASGDFSSPTEVVVGNNLNTLSYTDSTFNILLNKLKLTAKVATDIKVRIKADLVILSASTGQTLPASIYSNVLELTATSYKVTVVYPSIYVLGGYEGWSASTADQVYSLSSNGIYSGYVYMGIAGEFKFAEKPDFSGTNYGAGSGSGTLSTDGSAGNLSISAAGFYILTANVNTLTWSYQLMSWAMIGDAIDSWSVDTPLTWDATNKVLSYTGELKAGTFKFRANGSYDNQYGDDGAGGLSASGGNLTITTAGNYTITLDLISSPGSAVYSIVKN